MRIQLPFGFGVFNHCIRYISATYILVKVTSNKQTLLTIRRVNKTLSNKPLPLPFKSPELREIQHISEFVIKYLEVLANEPFGEFYGFWHKINRAWQSGILNASLSICVSIEGILKTYFNEYGLPDDEITKQANESLEKLKQIELGDRISARIQGTIT